MKHIGCLAALFFLLFCSSYVEAETVRDAHTEVELISEAQTIHPGMQFYAGVFFKMDPEWHIYWENPGDSGMTPKIEWKFVDGVFAGEIQWPYPMRIDLPPLSSYGYEKEVLLAVPFQVSENYEKGKAVTLSARLHWLACKVECIPGKADLTLSIPGTQESQPLVANRAQLFSETRFRWPLKQTDWNVSAHIEKNNLKLDFQPPATLTQSISQIYFFPKNPELIQHAAPQTFVKTSTGYQLEIPLSLNYPKDLQQLSGVLVSTEGWRGANSEKSWEIDIPFGAFEPSLPVSQRMGIIAALVFAFIGGLILNLMPCVLPVLSLKVLAFVREASEKSTVVWKHGLFFLAGVLSSFWFLAGLLIAFQAAGQQVGWGFQLQSPYFVGFLCVLFFILSLNLLGFFEIGIFPIYLSEGKKQKGWLSAFSGGVLATVVATPCTAPFMGAALGFALSQPAFVVWLVFTALGFGMALPYLLLCLFPGWMKWVPKPGAWMIYLKRVLGCFMLLTTIWLVWVFSIQTGIQQKFFKVSQEGKIDWEPYSEKRLLELQAKRRSVFIDFTAAWCLTCQVNEKVALNIPQVHIKLEEKNIAALKADWTSQDPAITRALRKYGRDSIPLYVFHPYYSGAPTVILPEILTPAIVLKALEDEKLQKTAD